ncbi:MAG: glycosyl transferase family 2 [Bacteroidota bacterium]
MNISIIIQARTGSTRLPKKMVLPFYNGKSVLELLIEKLKANFSIPIVLATTVNPSDDAIEAIAKAHNILCFRGDENNVLKRFIDCATHHKIETVIRVCADNPFLEVDFIKQLIEEYNSKSVNYISYSTANAIPAMKTHFGLFAELVELNALKKAAELTTEALYTEHVTNYIYAHPETFTLKFIQIPTELAKYSIRLTLDTATDFKNLEYIYDKLSKLNKEFSHQNILLLLKNEPNLLLLMKQEIENNSK